MKLKVVILVSAALTLVAAGCGFLYEHANNFLAAGAAEVRTCAPCHIGRAD